jgi:hypothetical protein
MTPEHIPISEISAPPPDYEWDDWDPYAPLGEHDESTMDVLDMISDRGKIVYAIGCAEWVVYRLGPYFDDIRPYQFLEACWAFEMKKGYEAPKPLLESEWKGKIRGAIDLSLVTILNTYYATEEGGAEVEAALAELIALHVLADTTPFLEWRSRILSQLSEVYPKDPVEMWGDPIPRQAVNPFIEIGQEDQLAMVQEFLNGLNPKVNKYLNYTGGDNSL